MAYSPNGKGMVLLKIVFRSGRSGNCHGKSKNSNIKDIQRQSKLGLRITWSGQK